MIEFLLLPFTSGTSCPLPAGSGMRTSRRRSRRANGRNRFHPDPRDRPIDRMTEHALQSRVKPWRFGDQPARMPTEGDAAWIVLGHRAQTPAGQSIDDIANPRRAVIEVVVVTILSVRVGVGPAQLLAEFELLLRREVQFLLYDGAVEGAGVIIDALRVRGRASSNRSASPRTKFQAKESLPSSNVK